MNNLHLEDWLKNKIEFSSNYTANFDDTYPIYQEDKERDILFIEITDKWGTQCDIGVNMKKIIAIRDWLSELIEFFENE